MTGFDWWMLGTGLGTLVLVLGVLTMKVMLGRHRIDPIGKQWGGLDNTAAGTVASFQRSSYSEPAWRWLPFYRLLFALTMASFAAFMLQLFRRTVE